MALSSLPDDPVPFPAESPKLTPMDADGNLQKKFQEQFSSAAISADKLMGSISIANDKFNSFTISGVNTFNATANNLISLAALSPDQASMVSKIATSATWKNCLSHSVDVVIEGKQFSDPLLADAEQFDGHLHTLTHPLKWKLADSVGARMMLWQRWRYDLLPPLDAAGDAEPVEREGLRLTLRAALPLLADKNLLPAKLPRLWVRLESASLPLLDPPTSG